ncbi:MAG: hypothetical protein WCR20_01215 [Verrucomicrobiota bacterium]
MNIKNINRSFVFGVASFLFLAAFHNASALTISPVRMEVSGDPGSTITKDITLFNDNKTTEETYYVTYSNFESQGETGSPLFVEPKSDLGTWINTADKVVVLKPGETRTLPFTMTIPKDAYSGGHFAAIFFGNNPGEGGQVSVGAKTGSLVLLTVNGKVLEAGGLSSFGTVEHKSVYNSLPISMEYRFKNDGNDRVKPEGTVTVRNMFYMPVSKINANIVSGNILPHSTRLFSGIDWTYNTTGIKESVPVGFFNAVSYQWKNFALGPYFVHLDLAYGSNSTHSVKNIMLFVLPWQLLIIIIIILAIVIFGGREILKAYNKSIIERARMGITNTPSDASHA